MFARMSPRHDRRVLLLHTGGTLGMVGSPLGPGAYEAVLAEAIPEVRRLARVEAEIVCNLDSSDMGPDQWTALATRIAAARGEVDGVVVVHGTDTMAYTASALAFALEGLDMPVVLTGAQRPLLDVRTDARRNLQDAVEVATLDIPEVTICFDGLLFRGCRAVKTDAFNYRAFASPGVAPLAHLGVDVAVEGHVRRPTGPFRCDPRFDPRVMVVQVAPGLDPSLLLRLVDDSPLRGLVLAAFGMGTAPQGERAIAPVVRRAVDNGIDVVVVSQRGGGVRLGAYRNAELLAEAGAIGGGEMLVEAAVPKLMHALAVHDDRAVRRAWLERNVAGEMG